eukprot:754121-Hanusia_phi.AAC.1
MLGLDYNQGSVRACGQEQAATHLERVEMVSDRKTRSKRSAENNPVPAEPDSKRPCSGLCSTGLQPLVTIVDVTKGGEGSNSSGWPVVDTELISKDLSPFVARFKSFECMKKHDFPSNEFLSFWGIAQYAVFGFSKEIHLVDILQGLYNKNNKISLNSKVMKSLSAVSNADVTIQHLLRAFLSIDRVWEDICSSDFWGPLDRMHAVPGKKRARLEDFVLLVLASTHSHFSKGFKEYEDHKEMMDWMHRKVPAQIHESLKKYPKIHDYFLKMLAKMFKEGETKLVDMLSCIQSISNFMSYRYLKYSDKFLWEWIGDMADKKDEESNKLVFQVARSMQYMHFEPLDYVLFINVKDLPKDEFHVIYLRQLLMYDNPCCSPQGCKTFKFFSGVFYGNYGSVFGEDRGFTLFSMENIFGECMKPGMDPDQQRMLQFLLMNRLMKKEPCHVYTRGDYYGKEKEKDVYVNCMFFVPANHRNVKFATEKEISSATLNIDDLITDGDSVSTIESSNLDDVKFVVKITPVDINKLSSISVKLPDKKTSFPDRSIEDIKKQYSAFDLRDDLFRMVDKKMVVNAKITDGPSYSKHDLNFNSDIKETFSFNVVEDTKVLPTMNDTFNSVCKHIFPVVMNLVCGNEIGNLVYRISADNLRRMLNGFDFSISRFRLSFDESFRAGFCIDQSVITIDLDPSIAAEDTETMEEVDEKKDATNDEKKEEKKEETEDKEKQSTSSKFNMKLLQDTISKKMESCSKLLILNPLKMNEVFHESLLECFWDVIKNDEAISKMVQEIKTDMSKYQDAVEALKKKMEQEDESKKSIENTDNNKENKESNDDVCFFDDCPSVLSRAELVKLAKAENVSPKNYVIGWRKMDYFCSCNSKLKVSGKAKMDPATKKLKIETFICDRCYRRRMYFYLINTSWEFKWSDFVALKDDYPSSKYFNVVNSFGGWE